MTADLIRLLSAATERRRAAAERSDAYRLVDDAADGFPGVVVDRYADFGVLSFSTEAARGLAKELCRALLATDVRGIYLKHRLRADLRHEDRAALAPAEPECGEPAPDPLVVCEDGIHFGVSLGDGFSTGLFTDQRDNRKLVRAISPGSRVLNLFAYTCSFTVAAALGGAKHTTSVDLSQRALTRGHENLERNGVSGPSHRLLRGDALAFLARARRRGDRFDLVILDPPSFGTRRRGTFAVERDYGRAAEDALAVLESGGRLLAVTHHRETSRKDLHALLRRSAERPRRVVQQIVDLPLPADHVYRPHGEEPTKSVLVTVE